MFYSRQKSINNGSTGFVATLWLTVIFLPLLVSVIGCGSGDLTAPDDINASWNGITYQAPRVLDTLTIDSAGNIELIDGETGPEAGLLSPGSWRLLETTIAGANLEPIIVDTNKNQPTPTPREGLFYIQTDVETVGFSWSDFSALTEPQQELVQVLQQIRENALTPISERINIYHGVRLLHGYDATIKTQAQFLIRDTDTLLDVLNTNIGRETVAMPSIDFERHVVLAVFLGPRDPQAYDLQIWTEISLMVGGYYHISIDRFTRAPGCPVPESNGGVFELIRMPKLDQEIYLDWNVIETGCTETAFQ
jgi:hypothetical protein